MHTVKDRLRFGLAVALSCLALGAPRRAGAEALTLYTLRPILIADVNALQANRYFVQSMLAFNSTPFTVGVSSQQAKVTYARIDGQEVSGGLAKEQFVLSLGWGRPATGFAAYGVLNFATAMVANFPRVPLSGNYTASNIRGTQSAVFLAAGVAFQGWVLQYGYSFNVLRVHADQYGRLTFCGDGASTCPDMGYPSRPGAPRPVLLDVNDKTVASRMLTFENKDGYSLGALLAALQGAKQSAAVSLAALRLLAQPKSLVESLGASVGAGVNAYNKGLDYYGDTSQAAAVAARAELPPPESKGAIIEIPILADRIAGTGFNARLVAQLAPIVTPRLAEVGYVHAGDETRDLVPHFGARAKIFRRASHAELGTDAYAGLFWVTTRSTREDEGRGLSLFATYSYNSPDASNFMPLPKAQVFGVQVVWGNPAALAPPIPSVRVPQSARYERDES